jgi:hypothetical protein
MMRRDKLLLRSVYPPPLLVLAHWCVVIIYDGWMVGPLVCVAGPAGDDHLCQWTL